MANVSNEVLQRTPERVLPFLRAIGTNAAIRNAMGAAGYTEADHEEGWKLLLGVAGFAPGAQPVSMHDASARSAIAELDAWDESGFRRIRAALDRFHPEASRELFEGVTASTGAGAVVAITTVLDRLDAFESGSEAHKAAVATLDKRGIGKNVRQQLRDLIAIAKKAELPATLPQPATESVEQSEKLGALYAWYRDWSETARAVVRRRDHLQQLGLAQRKRSKRSEDVGGDEPAEPGIEPVPGPAPSPSPSPSPTSAPSPGPTV